jgi:hypothetical protein
MAMLVDRGDTVDLFFVTQALSFFSRAICPEIQLGSSKGERRR